MNKRDVFFAALNENAHYRKSWVIRAFSVTRPKEGQTFEPWDIRYSPDKTEVLARVDGNLEWTVIDDVVPMTAVYTSMEPLAVKAGEVPNLSKDVDTTYGDVLFNWRVLVYAFGKDFEYQVGPINIRSIESVIAERMVDDPLPGEPEDESKLYVRKYLRFGQAMADLDGFGPLFVPTTTEKSLQTHPEARKRRQELLEENHDRLHDPAVVAKIQDELIKLDKEWLKGDPAEGFLKDGKSWNTARKRMFLIHGPEAGFDQGTDAELVVNSLDEGWDVSKMPAMINSLRAGSYYRGKLTALGGESVKFFLRVFQNTYITEDDCGSKLGLVKKVDKSLIGSYQITKDGVSLITSENIGSIGSEYVTVRTPLYCRTAASDYCKTCMGAHNSENPLGLGSAAADIGSAFMGIMMSAAHAKELKTRPLKTDSFLS